MDRGLSVVIPSWNGLHLLQANLPTVLQAIRYYSKIAKAESELVVVDDGSTDSTPRDLPQLFPDVQLVVRPENGGFARACNSGFAHCHQPRVALINNDVQVEEDYFVQLVRPLEEDPDAFAVTAKVFEFSPPIFATGGKVARFRRGFWAVYTNYDVEDPDRLEFPLISGYAVGGFACYDREKLARLGGFLELLSPFHWEDVDLSYRAWKRGWKVIYQPRARAFHEISATIDAHFAKTRVEEASIRNRLLFHWVNLHSTAFLLSHCWMLLLKLLSRIWVLDLAFYRAFASALRALPQAITLRRQEKLLARRDDRQLARLFSEFWKRPVINIYHDRKEVQQRHPETPGEATKAGSLPPR